MWSRQQMVAVAKTPKVFVSAVSVSSTLLGAAAGYFYARTTLSKKYAALADEEIRTARDFYARVFDKGEPEDLVAVQDEVELLPQPSTDGIITEDDVMEAVEALGQYKGDPVDPEFVAKMNEVLSNPGQQEVAEVVDKNVWEEEAVELPEPEQFVPAKSSARPYLITAAEFFDNEANFIEDSYTFFDGDDTLADRNDMVVLDVDGTVGRDNLARWGWNPDEDEDEIYICNIAKGLVINVTKSDGSYSQEVAGFDPDAELKHSQRRPLKMREHME